MATATLIIKNKGGPGSGFRGHAGRPKQVGGSSSAGFNIGEHAKSIASEALKIGKQYFGKDLFFHEDPNKVSESDVEVRNIHSMERQAAEDIGEVTYALNEAGEYVFIYDPDTKKGKPLSLYRDYPGSQEESITTESVNDWYANERKGNQVLVAYGDGFTVILPSPGKKSRVGKPAAKPSAISKVADRIKYLRTYISDSRSALLISDAPPEKLKRMEQLVLDYEEELHKLEELTSGNKSKPIKGTKSMKRLNIKQLKIKNKAFYGHAGRPEQVGGSQAARGSSRAAKPVSSVYPKLTSTQKIRAVATFARRSGAAGALAGARTGMRIGATAGGLIGGLALPALGTLTGSMVGAIAGIQYGAMIGNVKGVADAFLSLGNKSKMLDVYKRSTSAALKASARETLHEVVGTGINFAKSYAIKFATSKAYDFAVGKIFEAKTGRKWSDFKDFIKNKKKQQAYQAWQGSQQTEQNWLNKVLRLTGHAFQATQTINLKPRKKNGKVVWSKEIIEPDILKEWPVDLTTMLDNFEKRIKTLQKADEDTTEYENAFYEDMDALVNEIDAGSTE